MEDWFSWVVFFFCFDPFIFQSSTVVSDCWPSSVYFFQNDLYIVLQTKRIPMPSWCRKFEVDEREKAASKNRNETVWCQWMSWISELFPWMQPLGWMKPFQPCDVEVSILRISSQRICKVYCCFLWKAKPEVGSTFGSDVRPFLKMFYWAGVVFGQKKLWWIFWKFSSIQKMTCQIVGQSKMCLDQLWIVCR